MPGGIPISLEHGAGNDYGANTGGTGSTGMSPNASANAKGTYAQIIAATTRETSIICVDLEGGSTGPYLWDLAVGASGVEKTIISNASYSGSQGIAVMAAVLILPINIPLGARLAGRIQSATASDGSVGIMVTGYEQGEPGMEGVAGAESIGAVTASSRGTTMTSGAIHTKGSYAVLSTSAPRDYLGFFVGLDNTNNGAGVVRDGLIDIATGPSGTEKVIVPNLLVSLLQGTGNPPWTGPFWIPIAAGTRIASRFQASAASVTVNAMLLGLY